VTSLFVVIWLHLAIQELEDLLLSHPDIEDAAVIGVYNSDEVTEVPKAYGKHTARYAFEFFDIEAS
jgi:acyl-coenzyme A synthetase/AMP-(fatty) acid ligase